jgi:L-amino acid N-acyltransferase YncA
MSEPSGRVTPMVAIREATDDDVPAITAIHNALIPTTTIEWTDALHTVEDRRRWLAAKRDGGFPVLVAVEDDVLGWGAYGEFRDATRWPGYRFTVEHSIHVRGDVQGRGVGRLLLEALVAHARDAGKRVLVAAIDGENERSIAFHERHGFAHVGRLPGVGEKFGRRLDLVLMQRNLTDGSA